MMGQLTITTEGFQTGVGVHEGAEGVAEVEVPPVVGAVVPVPPVVDSLMVMMALGGVVLVVVGVDLVIVGHRAQEAVGVIG